MKKRVAIYVRVSKVGDRVLRSDKDQFEACLKYCEIHGYEAVVTYVDLDEKGANAGRVNLLAMVKKVLDGELDGIVVYNLSRLSRLKPIDRVTLFDTIESDGGFVKSTQEATDATTPAGRFAREVFLAAARYEWEMKAEGFESQKAAAIARGVHVSGTCPFGYRWVRIEKELQPLELDKDTARLVKRAFRMRAAGGDKGTLGAIQRFLAKETGHGWDVHRVTSMLKNRVYLGEARQGKHVKPGAHTALVTQDVFDVVQAMFAVPTTPHRSDAAHLLSGLVRCDSCGYGLHRTRTGGKYFVYRCDTRKATQDCTARVSIMAEPLEAFISDEWRTRMDGLAAEPVEAPEPDDGLEDLLARLAAARNATLPFEDPEYVAEIGIEAAKRGARSAREKIERLESELAERIGSNGHSEAPHPAELRRLFDEADTNGKRELLEGAIEAITVSRVPRGTPVSDPARVHIHWVGDGTAPARPSRGRPRKTDEPKIEAGVLAA